MCLIAIAYRHHPRYPLIIAANRDEFYRRPTAAAAFWSDHPAVLGGRDLDHLGTWLGITHSGKFAALTNYRDPSAVRPNAKSRGELVSDFLVGDQSPYEYLRQVDRLKGGYNGFNLLVGDPSCLLYYSNRTGVIQEVSPGIHALSNHLIDTPWPKVKKIKNQLAASLDGIEATNGHNLLSILADAERPPDEELPATGVSLEWERLLSSIYIEGSDYGTRCSTILLQDNHGRVSFTERTLPAGKDISFEFIVS